MTPSELFRRAEPVSRADRRNSIERALPSISFFQMNPSKNAVASGKPTPAQINRIVVLDNLEKSHLLH